MYCLVSCMAVKDEEKTLQDRDVFQLTNAENMRDREKNFLVEQELQRSNLLRKKQLKFGGDIEERRLGELIPRGAQGRQKMFVKIVRNLFDRQQNEMKSGATQ